MWWKPASSLFCSPRATKAPNHRAVLTLDYTVTGSSLQDTGKHQNARITFSLPSTRNSCIFIKVKKKDKIKIPSVYRNLLGPEHTFFSWPEPNCKALSNSQALSQLFLQRNSYSYPWFLPSTEILSQPCTKLRGEKKQQTKQKNKTNKPPK